MHVNRDMFFTLLPVIANQVQPLRRIVIILVTHRRTMARGAMWQVEAITAVLLGRAEPTLPGCSSANMA
jgi:hypothetical protein